MDLSDHLRRHSERQSYVSRRKMESGVVACGGAAVVIDVAIMWIFPRRGSGRKLLLYHIRSRAEGSCDVQILSERW